MHPRGEGALPSGSTTEEVVLRTKKDEKFSFLHTRQRMSERYGLELNWKEYRTLSRDMKLAKEYTSEKQGQRVSTLMFKGTPVIVVFDEKRQRVTTVLPKTYKTKRALGVDRSTPASHVGRVGAVPTGSTIAA